MLHLLPPTPSNGTPRNLATFIIAVPDRKLASVNQFSKLCVRERDWLSIAAKVLYFHEYTIQPKPRMVVNDMRSLLAYAKQGLGLAYLYREIAVPHLEDGGLTEVLSGQVGQLPRYSLNYRSKRNMTRRLRAFVDMAKASGKAA